MTQTLPHPSTCALPTTSPSGPYPAPTLGGFPIKKDPVLLDLVYKVTSVGLEQKKATPLASASPAPPPGVLQPQGLPATPVPPALSTPLPVPTVSADLEPPTIVLWLSAGQSPGPTTPCLYPSTLYFAPSASHPSSSQSSRPSPSASLPWSSPSQHSFNSSNLSSLTTLTPTNSNAFLANPTVLLANPNVLPAGPNASPSPPKPLEPSSTVPDTGIHH
ncbi:hypothetical protein E4T56_gene4977 [Termitomyces sp. T112]|nr:hypothetical protein E4T56_gene4977 [Termitomyces sp. T112]